MLKEKILKEEIVLGKDILKVDSFLNHKVDANLKTVQETLFYKNGVISQGQRLHKLHESGMLTSKDVEQDIDEVNARFLAKMKAAGLQ